MKEDEEGRRIYVSLLHSREFVGWMAPLLIKRKWRGKRRLRSSVEDIRPLKVSTVSTPSRALGSKNPALSVSPESYKTKETGEKVYQFQSRMV